MNYTHLMPLTDHVIDSTVQRYRREVDCYEKLCRFVAMKCEREIIRENTIRAGITYLPGEISEQARSEVAEEI
jgi:hypothetical protein